jgi:hypothetical protein
MTDAEKKLIDAAIKWALDNVHFRPRDNNELEAVYDATNVVVKERLTPEVIAAEEAAMREYFASNRKFHSRKSLVKGQVWSEMWDRIEKEFENE